MATIANEVKQEILDKVKSGQKVSEVSNQYGVSSRTIYLWLRKGVANEVSLVEYRRLKKENQELKAIVGTLIVQLEKTKKRTEIRLESQRLLDQQGQIVCLSRLSAWFGLSRSGNYYQLKQTNKDELLKKQVLSVLESNPGYGHRRIALALGLGKRRVRRVMKLFGIKAYKRKRNWRKRRDERKPEAGFPNLVKGICPIRPNLVWATDFTYLRFKNSFIYLCTFMDLFTRQIVGWNLSTRHTKQLIINAFFDAFQNTETIPNIVHSDQGVEYTNKDYIQLMTDLRIRISMSQKASPWQNGYQESFYHNFKTDLGLEFDRFDTVGQFVEAIHQTINYYNQQRIHTSLKMPPSQFYLLHQIQFQQLSKKTST